MANKMRRLTALVLALVLCVTQLVLPSAATESQPETQPVVTIEAKPAGSTTVKETTKTDPVTGVTTTTTTTTTKDSAGTTTKVEQTVEDKANGVTTESETTTTKTKDPNKTTTESSTTITDVPNGTVIEEQSKKEEEKTVNGNTTTKEITEEGSKTTTVKEEDKENNIKTETVTNEENKSEQTLESVSKPVEGGTIVGTIDTGESSSKTETTTTVTETTEKVKNGEEDDPTQFDLPEEHENPEIPKPKEEDWALGTVAPKWGEEQIEKGDEITQLPGGESRTQPNVKLGETLTEEDADDVTLTMKYGGEGTFEREITTKDLRSGKFPQIYNPATQQDGDLVEDRDASGELIGWTITNAKTGEITKVTQKKDDTGKLTHWIISHTTETPGKRTPVTDAEHPDGVYITNEEKLDGDFTYQEIAEMEENLKKQAEQGQQETKVDENTTEVLRYEKIEENDVIGYKTVKETITVDVADPVQTEITPELAEKYDEAGESVAVYRDFQLPAEPQPVTNRDNGDGTVTNITVTPIYQDKDDEFTKAGDVIGYEIQTSTTKANSKEYSNEVKQIYGTAYRKTVTTTFDPTTLETIVTTTTLAREIDAIYNTKHTRTMDLDLEQSETFDTIITTDTDTYELISTDAGDYILYKGKMYGIVDNSHELQTFDLADYDHVSMTGYTDANDLRMKDQFSNYYTGQVKHDGSTDEWRFKGYGLFTHFVATVDGGEGNPAHSIKQFMVRGKNQKGEDETRVVYCIELGTDIFSNAYYDREKLDKKDDQSGVPWAEAEGTVRQIHSVAQNGFWGTANGLGSLQAVKDLMTRNNLGKEAERLTEGMAVAATQLALWAFGAKEGVTFKETSPGSGDYLTFDDGIGAAPTAEDKKTITSLRNLLIQLANSAEDGNHAEKISAKHIEEGGGSIKIKEEVASSNTSGGKTYNTDISFTMKISTSSLNGDLVMSLKRPDGSVIKKFRLAGNGDKDITDLFGERVHPSADGTYTLKDVELVEGQPVTLHLEGTQHLEDGVYLYQEDTSQDFVGLSTLEYKVDLSFKMEFDVVDPEFSHQTTQSSATREDTARKKGEAVRADTANVTVTDQWEEKQVNTDTHKNILSTRTVVKECYQITGESLEWEKYYEEFLEDEDGNEKQVLADVPRTGDYTMLWAVICLMSLSAASILSIQPKRKTR